MEAISKNTKIENFHQFLSDNGYECGEISDNVFVFSLNKVKATLMLLPSGNVMFMSTLALKENLEEIDALRKINDINFQIISGNLAIKDNVITYCFTLIRPYGMGEIGFKNFVDYHMYMMSYIVDELGLSEITK